MRGNRVLRSGVIVVAFAAAMSSADAQAFCLDRDESLCHPDMVRLGLGFLRPEIADAVIVGVSEADEGFQSVSSDVHMDECDFEAGSSFVSDRFDDLVSDHLAPGDGPGFFRGIDKIGELLHPLQDFYSHSNWYLLGRTDLVHGSIGGPIALEEWTILRDDIIVLSGNKDFSPDQSTFLRIPPGWTVVTPPNTGVPIVTAPNGDTFRGLISGSPDGLGGAGSPFSDCPLGADFSHETLNRDNFTREGHCKVAALALEQTTTEWCRLMTELSDAHGVMGPAMAMALLVDGNNDNHLLSCAPYPAGTNCEAELRGSYCGPHIEGTPCGPPEYGPIEVTVSVDELRVLDDHDPFVADSAAGELNYVLAAYTTSLRQSARAQGTRVVLDDDEHVPTGSLPAPLTLCLRPDDVLVATVQGWEDDDGAAGQLSGDAHRFDSIFSDDDDIVEGASFIGLSGLEYDGGGGGPVVASSSDVDVAFQVQRTTTDTDGDGLPTCEEVLLGTDRGDADSDDDGLLDGAEVNVHGTDPSDADTDDDGLSDGQEIALGTDPLDADSDDDGLSDGEEIAVHGTDPLNPDSDADGLTDGDEVHVHGTNPLDADTDDDGLTDGFEVQVGTDPVDADTDDDGLADGQDVDWIEAAIQALPSSVFKSLGKKTSLLQRLAAIEDRLHHGQVSVALGLLVNVRKQLDGCGAVADPNDSIVQCATQLEIRALLDVLTANLAAI